MKHNNYRKNLHSMCCGTYTELRLVTMKTVDLESKSSGKRKFGILAFYVILFWSTVGLVLTYSATAQSIHWFMTSMEIWRL